jgi:GT2 family glycosyltransferase
VDLSIIIINWNTKALLKDCLCSVFCETKDISFEVIVVDNGSTDGSAMSIRQNFPNVRLIENQKNLGYSAANNQGIKLSKGRYICLLNSDTVILENAISKLTNFLDEKPEIGAATCLLLNPDGSPQFGSALGETNLLYMLSVETGLYRIFPKNRIWGRPFLSYLDHEKPHELEVCPSAVIVIRREVIEKVGLLDENIFFGVIDWDYSYRIRKYGWKLYFYPFSRVIHYGGKSKKPIRYELLKKDYKSQFYYFHKHYGQFHMFLFRLLIMLSSSIKLLLSLYIDFLKKKKINAFIKNNKTNNHWTRLKISFSSLSFSKDDSCQ